MEKVILASGNELKLQDASIEEAQDLLDIIIKNVSGKVEIEEDMEVGDMLAHINKAIFSIAADKNMRAAFMACARHCTYRGEKITNKSFDDREARSDYYEAMIEIIRYNITPFMNSLVPAFKGVMKLLSEIMSNAQMKMGEMQSKSTTKQPSQQ